LPPAQYSITSQKWFFVSYQESKRSTFSWSSALSARTSRSTTRCWLFSTERIATNSICLRRRPLSASGAAGRVSMQRAAAGARRAERAYRRRRSGPIRSPRTAWRNGRAAA
jgi:hypothetical protein